MDGSVLDISYDLNDTRSKKVTVGFDVYDGFKPIIWLHKAGALRIRLRLEDWASLMSAKPVIEDFFKQEAYTYQSFSLCDSLYLTLTEAFNKRLIKLEHIDWPVTTTSRPKSPARLWLSEKHWLALLNAQPCVEAMYQRHASGMEELRTLYETLIENLNILCGDALRQKYGDVSVVEAALCEFNLGTLCYTSQNNLDVERALLELRHFNVDHIARTLQYPK